MSTETMVAYNCGTKSANNSSVPLSRHKSPRRLPDGTATTTTTTDTTRTITKAAVTRSSTGRGKKQTAPRARRTSGSSSENSKAGGVSTKKECPLCAKRVSFKAFADHIKVHKLMSDEHGTPATRPCRNCTAKGRQCRVARAPGRDGLNTFRCKHCLQYHENCSYMVDVRGLDVSANGPHPGME